MKVTIEYDLDKPDNKRLLDLALKADKYNIALFDIAYNIRSKARRKMTNPDEDTLRVVVEEVVRMIEEEAGLTYEDLEYHANG